MTESFDHVIVGGGMTADAAAKAIHEATPDASVLIVSADVDAPYTRPALSKKLWTDPDYTEADNDLGTVADRFDHVLVLNRRVIAAGPVGEAFTPAALARAYGVPLAV